MANTDRPNGFRPYRYLNGSPWNGQCRKYEVPVGTTTSIFVGDLVTLSTDAPTEEYAAVKAAGTSDIPIGALVAIDPAPPSKSLAGGGTSNINLSANHVAATTKTMVWVADDPNILFAVQEDSATTPIALASIGLNATFVATAGNTTTGASGYELDSDSVDTTNTLPLKVIGIVNSPNNEIDATNGSAKIIVQLNTHQLATGGTGV